MVLRWRHWWWWRLRCVDLDWRVHVVIVLIHTHRWATHRRVDTTHARKSKMRRWLFRWCHLKWFLVSFINKCPSSHLLLTSNPILPLSENLIGFEWLLACINVVKWLIPISSSDDFLRPWFIPRFGKPCRKELDRLKRMSLSIWNVWRTWNFHWESSLGEIWVLPSASCFVLAFARLVMDCLEVKVNLILLSLMVVHEGSDNHFAFVHRPSSWVRSQIRASSWMHQH